jgi:hypothetical protein
VGIDLEANNRLSPDAYERLVLELMNGQAVTDMANELPDDMDVEALVTSGVKGRHNAGFAAVANAMYDLLTNDGRERPQGVVPDALLRVLRARS